jgi:hypothetical protein
MKGTGQQMPWTTSSKVVELREQSAAVDVFVGTLDGWRRHLSGRNASVLSLFGFLTIFPLLLVATTILGFVLEDNEELQQKLIDGALANVPILGEQLADGQCLGPGHRSPNCSLVLDKGVRRPASRA